MPSSQSIPGPLEQALGYQFRDPALLVLSLTHPSLANEAGTGAPQQHNQRLEFLGDAVLQLVITLELYRNFPGSGEGPLTQARAQMVNRSSLAEQGRRLGLGEHLILSRGEETTGGRTRASTLADAFEAVGAVRLRFGGETTTLLCARIDPALGDRVEVSVLGASLPAPKPAPKPKKGAKAVDAGQPLFGFATEETLRRGQFGGTPMTFIEGQDVDVPTYIRKAVRLPAG